MTTESTAAADTNIAEKPAAPETPTVTPLAPTPNIVAPPDVAPAWVWKADYLIYALVLVLTFFLASFTATNSDLWLNLAVGRRISEGTLQFGVDPFSWASVSQDGAPVEWIYQSWLFSWLLFQLHELIGGEGLVFIKALLIVAAIGFLSRIAWREPSRWFMLIGLAMAGLAMSGRLALQPIVVSLLFLSITLYVLHRAGVFALRKDAEEPTCPRWLWALPPLFALWVNLDQWFILGPILVGLCWLASGLGRFFPSQDFACERAGLVSGTRLGLIFGLGLLACLLNPFHVRAFQLPPELAYLVLSVTDTVGLALPDAVVAGGRALKEVRRTDPDLATWTISSLSPDYWRVTQRGLNVAGLALYPLILLGLLAFTLVSMIRANTSAPTLHLSRFLIWLFFGVVALALYRMIPFFVIVAAPLTALTLGEFLQWQQVSASVAVHQRDRGLNLARFITVPFMLLLLYLAWPGWLHGTTEFNSSRHVAWQIRPDASQHEACLVLKALKDKGECRNVFNSSYDLGNYLPWFAPDVKYGMDTRFSLFAAQAAAYGKTRQSLAIPDPADEDWLSYFQAHDIDQVVLANYLQSKQRGAEQDGLLKIWVNADHWRQRYIDGRTLVVSWRGPKETWETEQLLKDLNRLAFGETTANQRPPQNGAPAPQALSFWTLYADGLGPQPVGVGQCRMLQTLYGFQHRIFHAPVFVKDAGAVNTISMTAWCGALPLTGSTVLPSTALVLNQWTMFQDRDNGPPALPILMVRAARRAVADNPHDVQAQAVLFEANELLRQSQEDRWIRPERPAMMRDRLRQAQLAASLYTAVQLAPDQFEANDRLANYYLQQNLLDLALEHKQIAEKSLEILPHDPRYDVKKLDASIKEYRDSVKSLDNAVKVRLSKWTEKRVEMPPLMQADHAYNGKFRDLINDRQVDMPLGLGKTALDVLLTLNPEKLTADQHIAALMLRFEILLAMGQGNIVMKDLQVEGLRKLMPAPVYAQYQLLAAGAVGDYETADAALKQLEAIVAPSIALMAPSMFVRPTMQSASPLGYTYTFQGRLALELLATQNNELCNLMTLRGILALEAGDTKKARAHFQAALDQCGKDYRFTERAIASRYVELLNEQKR